MSEIMTQALLITVIGMTLVFAAIILLALFMAALVRLTADKEEAQTEEAVQAAQVEAPQASHRKRRAAAIAVAYALANQADSTQPHHFPLPPTAIVSAWQAIMRTKILSKRGPTR
jgi:sodium pump decarboxylase gamma subunit